MGRLVAAVAVVVLVTAPLTGCIGGGGGSTSTDAASGETGGGSSPGGTASQAPEATSRPAALTFDAPAVSTSFTENGSFGPSETCVPAGCATGSYEHTVDITDRIPRGLPVRAEVTLEYQEDLFTFVDADLVAESGEVYNATETASFSESGGTIRINATLGRTGNGATFTVVVQGYWPDDGEATYTLDVALEGQPDLVPPQVPVSVPVTDATGGVTLEPLGAAGSGFEALSWTPDDRRHHLVKSDAAADYGAVDEHATGRHVILLRPPSESSGPAGVGNTSLASALRVRPQRPAPDAHLRMLGTEVTAGDAHPVQPGQTVSWQAQAPPTLVEAGIRIDGQGPVQSHGPAQFVRESMEGSLSSSKGPVVQFADDGLLLGVGGSVSYVYESGIGGANLAPGGYEASVTLHDGTPVEARHLFRTYVR